MLQGTFPLLRFKVNVGCLLCLSDCKIRLSNLGFSVLRICSSQRTQGKLKEDRSDRWEGRSKIKDKDYSSKVGSSRDGAGPGAEDEDKRAWIRVVLLLKANVVFGVASPMYIS
ncbi:hypothetical protein LINGRAHAP2_LOCUS4895 [Linum grandiflorum]